MRAELPRARFRRDRQQRLHNANGHPLFETRRQFSTAHAEAEVEVEVEAEVGVEVEVEVEVEASVFISSIGTGTHTLPILRIAP